MVDNARIKALSLRLLSGLGACPAVPFQEGMVSAFIQKSLGDMGLKAEPDAHGNLIVHRPGHSEDPGSCPPIAYVAHMDHPGFEAVAVEGDVVTARALGGVPPACSSEAVAVQIVCRGGERLNAETAGTSGPEDQRTISLRLAEDRPVDLTSPVVLDLPDFRFDGEMVHMRALDDLAGCAAILAALKELGPDEGTGDIYGVFTRAEEVGLIGARLLAEAGTLPADTLVISLEASRALPGAAIGEGPVIRVGDASFTFDAEAEAVLLRAREELAEQRADFKAQRQLMSGGTCEASAFRYYGYRTSGIAFPLGNYHNSTPDGGVGAEYIYIDDLTAGVELAVQAARCVARRHDSRPWRRMSDMPEEYRRRVAETAGSLQAHPLGAGRG